VLAFAPVSATHALVLAALVLGDLPRAGFRSHAGIRHHARFCSRADRHSHAGLRHHDGFAPAPASAIAPGSALAPVSTPALAWRATSPMTMMGPTHVRSRMKLTIYFLVFACESASSGDCELELVPCEPYGREVAKQLYEAVPKSLPNRPSAHRLTSGSSSMTVFREFGCQWR